MTGSEALARGARLLREAGVPDAAGDARRLLAHALGAEPGRLTLVLPEEVPRNVSEDYDALLARRARREPVSHLVGVRGFWGREFLVTPDVLDPRPETEVLVAAALEGPFGPVLDLGTGSGCLLVTLLAERPQATGQGLDLSHGALEVARANAGRHGVAARASFAASDWFAAAEGRFDLIVSNPPYIAAGEMPGLEPEVRDWEPRMALTDEGDGLGAYRAILAGARTHMAPGARLMLEHGPGQSDAIAAIGRSHGFPAPQVRRDLDGRARAIMFRGP
jgi:release factor glutamine methyltransferase